MLGSGLFAANFSSTFRMRPFGMVDCAPYALSLEVVTEGLASKDESKAGEDVEEKAVEAEKEEDEAEATAKKTIQLLPFRKKLPIKRCAVNPFLYVSRGLNAL